MKSTFETKLEKLMKDFGYSYRNGLLIEDSIPGYFPSRIIGNFKSALSAADYLCPIVKDDEFTTRLMDSQVVA